MTQAEYFAVADALVQDVPPDAHETRVSCASRKANNGAYQALALLAEEMAARMLARLVELVGRAHAEAVGS